MAGTLSIVATPIGHLEDITLRALSVLRAADLIAAEDTRRTGRLLAHFGIPTPTISFHEHNTRSRLPIILEQLKAGKSVALVSDAGTPMVSDPGLELVQRCIDEGIAVDPVPGASAPLTLAMVSGFPFCPWTIYGFPPARSSDRKMWLAEVVAVSHSVTFLEAPHRIERTLGELAEICGNRPIIVGRELTKLHQTLYRGTVLSVAEAGVEPRGEFTLMLGPAPRTLETPAERPSDRQLAVEFGEITENGSSGRRAAIKTLAERYELSAKEVYSAVERTKGR
jgi:16S rRNA (cytidine1402-2'-O)-methyltransferase